MNSPQKQPVMSKGTYYFLRIMFGVLGAQGYALVILGAVGILYLFVRWHRTLASHPTYTASMLLTYTLTITAGLFLVKRTNKAVQDANIVPLTNADIANIPASDSLVRASEEPMQQQQATLLRPAVQSAEVQQEQLLGASAGEQE